MTLGHRVPAGSSDGQQENMTAEANDYPRFGGQASLLSRAGLLVLAGSILMIPLMQLWGQRHFGDLGLVLGGPVLCQELAVLCVL